MQAVVMAAGEGRRLRPVTERWPKPVLPIDGRPVVATLARELAAAGLTPVTVVVGYLAEQIEELLGDGSAFGLELRYVLQPSADGTADAVRRALAAGASPPLVVTAADTVFTAGDLGQFATAFAESGAVAAVAVTTAPGGARVALAGDRVVRVPDDDPANPTAAPLWGLTERVTSLLDGLSGPPYELAQAVQHVIDQGAEVAGIPIRATRDLTDPVDLVRENVSYL
jgi:NDP-sugar pyrophosphorylase family protein